MASVIMTLGAASFGDSAFAKLERCLGAYPVDFADSWDSS